MANSFPSIPSTIQQAVKPDWLRLAELPDPKRTKAIAEINSNRSVAERAAAIVPTIEKYEQKSQAGKNKVQSKHEQ